VEAKNSFWVLETPRDCMSTKSFSETGPTGIVFSSDKSIKIGLEEVVLVVLVVVEEDDDEEDEEEEEDEVFSSLFTRRAVLVELILSFTASSWLEGTE
jgi:hypothetical protein